MLRIYFYISGLVSSGAEGTPSPGSLILSGMLFHFIGVIERLL